MKLTLEVNDRMVFRFFDIAVGQEVGFTLGSFLWDDDDFTNFQMSKINIHPHFFQFDNQASDGVISGFSYDQSMRSYTQFTKKMKDGHHVSMPIPMND